MGPPDRALIYEVTTALAMAGLIYLAFKVGGFIGVGVLGLLTAFIAFQADLDTANTASVFAMRSTPQERMDHAETAARRHEILKVSEPIFVGKLLGIALAAIGFGAFFFF
jgi:hypothetical protein